MSKNIYLISAETSKEAANLKFKELAKTANVYMPFDQSWSAGIKDIDWAAAMRIRINVLMSCDEIHLIPGWQHSRGCTLERDIALRLGMTIIYH